MAKIRCTKEVRELLIELDQAIDRFHAACKDSSHSQEAFLDKHAAEKWILGVAWRINKASKGLDKDAKH